MFSKVAFVCFMIYFIILKTAMFWIPTMPSTFGVCIPIINTHLSNWKNAWARHPLRTEGNHSPLHLWIAGLHMNAWSNQDNHEMAAGVSVWKETPFFCMNFICSHQKCSHEISSNGVFPLNHKRTCISLPFTFQKKKLIYKYKQ